MTILDVLNEHQVPYKLSGEHHHVHTGWVGIECSCTPNSGKYKRGINLTSLAVSCWTCGVFRLADTLAEVCRIPLHEAITFANQLRYNRKPIYYPPVLKKHQGTLKLPSGLKPLAVQHRTYLQNRGFDPDELERLWGVLGIGLSSRLAWRLFFPILMDGEMVSWTTRSISDNAEAKYVNASPEEEEISIKSTLFGLDYVRHSVIIVEGPLDAIKIGPGAVATMGVNITQEQIRLLRKVPVRVICLDSEPIAQIRARKLQAELAALPGDTYNATLTTGKDPSRASREEIDELRKRFLVSTASTEA